MTCKILFLLKEFQSLARKKSTFRKEVLLAVLSRHEAEDSKPVLWDKPEGGGMEWEGGQDGGTHAHRC